MSEQNESNISIEVEAIDRVRFEEAMYEKYLTATRRQAFESPQTFKGFIPATDFFRMKGNSGDYLVPGLNYAWDGYKTGLLHGAIDSVNEAKLEERIESNSVSSSV